MSLIERFHCTLFTGKTMATLVKVGNRVVWLGDVLWKCSLDITSHRNFAMPNISAAA